MYRAQKENMQMTHESNMNMNFIQLLRILFKNENEF
jgi:hypothetical protein